VAQAEPLIRDISDTAAVKGVEIKQYIVEGEFVATVFEMETMFGVDQVFDRVRVCDGELKEIHSFYYPPQSDHGGFLKRSYGQQSQLLSPTDTQLKLAYPHKANCALPLVLL
jgi:hypothetical protein